jgi:hypothetical protein
MQCRISANCRASQVKTTSPKKYCVRPNSGIVPPRSTSDVIGSVNPHTLPAKVIGDALSCICAKTESLSDFSVTMQAQKEVPPGMQCKDKFLVQSAVVTEGLAVKDITGEMVHRFLAPLRLCECFVLTVLTSEPCVV